MRVLCMYQSVPALTPAGCMFYWQIAGSFMIGCIPRHVHVRLATSLHSQAALTHAHLVLFLCLLLELRVILACKADHVFALAPAELIVSKEVDGECAFPFHSHEFAGHVFWGHHLRREQSHSAKAAMALLGKDFASSAFSPALATMDSLQCEQRQGRQHSTLRPCCRAGHRSQMSRCIRGRFTGREERL